jgi:inositol 1,4,5-triphosphate receptor type 3
MCEEALNISILFNQLGTYKEEIQGLISTSFSKKMQTSNKRIFKKAKKFFFAKIRTIEIINQNGELQRIFFALPPLSRFHSKFSRNTFDEKVDRGSSNEKLTGLTDEVPYLMLELNHFNQLSRGTFKASNFSVFFIF